ncbi:Ger(x)C family spore germination protein [Thermosyntropha sp.]|uniref:Ger(x)C family spore germination protein n=1 Tax=Thermosyntropha sp. TaxID=2740820 RepID=UPI0025FCF9E7|nr:Ger(x)C family spore germination protein [Thermosyntropha sp.]MBO8159129.1 Ger(x)C family spore germination protein [Thermosyntropha sp.]
MKKHLSLSLLFFVLLFVCGCWDAQDIEDFNVPLIAAYDLAKENGKEVRVTVLYPDVAQRNKELIEPVEGKTVGDTRSKRGTRFPSTLLLGHIQLALYGEKLAYQGLYSFIDNYVRNPRIKKSLYMAVVKGGSYEFLKEVHQNNQYLGFELPKVFSSKKKNQFFAITTLYDFAHAVTTTGKNPVLPVLSADKRKNYKIDGTAIFKKDKMIAIADMNETVPLILLRGIERCCGHIPFIITKEGKQIDKGTVEIASQRKVYVERKGDKFIFHIKLKINGRLVEHYTSERFLIKDANYIREVEKAVEEQIKRDCQKLILKMKEEWGVDCIDISRFALAKWRRELEDVIEDEDFIRNADIKVDAKVNIDCWGSGS